MGLFMPYEGDEFAKTEGYEHRVMLVVHTKEYIQGVYT